MSWLAELRERTKALLWRSREEREMEEELRFHLEMSEARKRARGQGADEAARSARLDLGGLERVKEEVRDARGVRWLEDLGMDLRYAMRTLSRTPAFAATAVLVVAMGADLGPASLWCFLPCNEVGVDPAFTNDGKCWYRILSLYGWFAVVGSTSTITAAPTSTR